jgi:uncharacterized protein YpbB
VLKAFREVGGQRLRPIKEALPDDFDYFVIRIALQKNGSGESQDT